MVTTSRGRERRGQRGFALIGLLAALAIVAMGLSVMVVFANRVLDEDRNAVVVEEMEEIYRAIVGDQRETFGYIGAIGTYPTSLIDLAVNPGNAGWRGPYLRDPRTASNMLVDPWGQPYEYWVIDGVATSDRLAIISRGPDGQSTNTAADPNVRTNFTGVTPADAAYFTDTRNADNVIFPRTDPSRGDNLNINTDSNLNITLNNFDSNPLVNAFVPACPNLFSITVQNVDRNENVVNAVGYAPGFEVLLPQGTYRTFVTSALLPTPPVNDRIVVFPVVPVFRTYNVTGLDSSGTDSYNLQLTNSYPLDAVTIEEFTSFKGNVAANGTLTVPIRGCSTVNIEINGAVVETFTMPFGATYSKIVGANAAYVVLTNNLSVTVNVYNDGLFIGDVKKNKTETFDQGLSAGNVITVRRADTNALLETVTLVADANAITVP